MSTLDIHLPDDLKLYLDEQVSRRGYKDASEFLGALLEAEKQRNFVRELEQSLVDALQEPSTPLTDDDFEQIRREGTAIIESRRRSS